MKPKNAIATLLVSRHSN